MPKLTRAWKEQNRKTTLFSISALVVLGLVLLASFWGYTALGGRGNPYDDSTITLHVTGEDGYDDDALHAALTYWEQGVERVGYPVTFILVDDPRHADIRLTFVDAETVPCGPFRFPAAGCGGILAGKGHATVAVQSSSFGQVITTTTHELGHALGLLHTRDEESVMHARVDGYPWYVRWLNYPWGNVYHA